MTDVADFPDPFVHEIDAPDRPDDCMCHDAGKGLPCFACYAAGFERPNPDAPAPLEVEA